MEKITDINQLNSGTEIIKIEENGFKCYEFLCVHPHNSSYILAIESASQDAHKIYIPNLIDGEYYFGRFDKTFVIKKQLERAKHRVKYFENLLEE